MSRALPSPLLAALLAAALVGCGGTTASPRAAEGPAAQPASPGALPVDASDDVLGDGFHTAWISSIDQDVIVLKPVEVLSRDEARAAAEAAASSGGDGELRRDVYVRDLGEPFYGARVADEATVTLYDCTDGCEAVSVDRSDFLAGAVAPGVGEGAIVAVEIVDSQVVSITERHVR